LGSTGGPQPDTAPAHIVECGDSHTIEDVMSTTPGIEIPVTKVSLHKQPSDFAYWQSQPYPTRLAALEQIRREYHRWRYGAEPRLQRVHSIVKR
jgi:hypothetical protein